MSNDILITAAQLFAAKQQVTVYDCPKELGEGLKIAARQFSVNDRREIMAFCGEDHTKAYIANIIYGICDTDGNRIFSNEDYDNISAMPEFLVAAMFTAVKQSNNYDERGIAKNS